MNEYFELSGFARVIGGYLDQQDVIYEGYKNEWSFSQQSLLGLQADLHITDTLTLAAQGLAHSADNRKSGLEWLYLRYQPNDIVQIKLGKLRTPFLQYSDVIDVGLAYPWISAPQRVYDDYLFTNYEGVSATVRFPAEIFSGSLEAYAGNYDDNIEISGNSTFADVNDIRGLILTLQNANLRLRTSLHQSNDVNVPIAQFDTLAELLRDAGFTESADSLLTSGGVQTFQVGFNYDDINYFLAAEYFGITSDSVLVVDTHNYYVSGGYNFAPYQVHLTWAQSRGEFDEPADDIPIGLAPELDALAAAYHAIFDNLFTGNTDSITLGLRYDFRANMAFKAEVTYLERAPDRRFEAAADQTDRFRKHATLFQVGLEWVF